jgi:hypothetical protein
MEAAHQFTRENIYLLLDALVGSVTGRASSEGLDLAHSILSNRLATGSVTGL